MKQDQRNYILKIMTIAGAVTFTVSCFVTWRFISYSGGMFRSVGVAMGSLGTFASFLSLHSGLLLLPQLSTQSFSQSRTFRIVLYVFTTVMILFSWWVILCLWRG